MLRLVLQFFPHRVYSFSKLWSRFYGQQLVASSLSLSTYMQSCTLSKRRHYKLRTWDISHINIKPLSWLLVLLGIIYFLVKSIISFPVLLWTGLRCTSPQDSNCEQHLSTVAWQSLTHSGSNLTEFCMRSHLVETTVLETVVFSGALRHDYCT